MVPEFSKVSEVSEEIAQWIGDFCLRHGLENQPALARDFNDICKRIDNSQISFQLFQLIEKEYPLIPDLTAAMTGLDRIISLQPDPSGYIIRQIENKKSFQRLLQIMGTSPFFNQVLFSQPEIITDFMQIAFDSKEILLNEAIHVTAGIDNERSLSNALRRFRQRISLAIASADFFEQIPLQKTTTAISNLADACIESALLWAIERNKKKFGMPFNTDRQPCRLVALSLGKLGGQELNYSSDVDLIFIYDKDGQTPGHRPLPAFDFFSRVIADFLRVMAGPGGTGFVLRVDLRLRPEGMQGPVVMNLEQALNYYDSSGRTWERQALIKVRPCAGHLALGEEFKSRIEPFVYRRYLNSMEIAEIQAMKRRIEHRSEKSGESEADVKTGYGGIRDVEFVVQFLQLLNGCTLSQLRCNNTLNALIYLKETGCLTNEEHLSLRRNYIFLRHVEHRLQLMDDRQTHRIPPDRLSRSILARLMGFHSINSWENPESPFERFKREYQKIAAENHEILNKLLHNTFQSSDEQGPDLLTDLILDPEMPPELIEQALAPIEFKNQAIALKLLADMSKEEKPFFSTPRCRHFFAALAPALLNAISQTPNPDSTISQIETMSRPIAGKVALWERLLRSREAQNSFVEIASFKRLTTDLISSRIDAWEDWSEFIEDDSKLSVKKLEADLWKLPQTGQSLTQQLKLFRDRNWLRISTAVRVPITTESTLETTRACADLAYCIISFTARRIWSDKLQQWRMNGSAEFIPGNWGVIALGKMGGQDLLFHSDIDLLFLHEVNPDLKSEKLRQAAESFFQELAGKLIRVVGDIGNSTVYRIDTRLRPYGTSGPLSASLKSMSEYYFNGDARIWEKLALLRSKPVFLNGFEELELVSILHRLSYGEKIDTDFISTEINNLRRKTLSGVETHSKDLKRSVGGLQEAELIIQGLQLSSFQMLIEPPARGLLTAVEQLVRMNLLTEMESSAISESYIFYRQVELALRLVRNRLTQTIEIEEHEIQLLEKMITDNSGSANMPIMEKIAFHQSQISRIFQDRFKVTGPPKVSATM